MWHWIDQILIDFDLTQRELSRKSGVSDSTISTNRGACTPITKSNSNMVRKFAKALGITVDDMYDRYDR